MIATQSVGIDRRHFARMMRQVSYWGLPASAGFLCANSVGSSLRSATTPSCISETSCFIGSHLSYEQIVIGYHINN